MKNPISVQAASIWRATSRRSLSLPLRSGDKSIVGIVFSAAMAHPSIVCWTIVPNYIAIDVCRNGI
jgi:hypothetical protein